MKKYGSKLLKDWKLLTYLRIDEYIVPFKVIIHEIKLQKDIQTFFYWLAKINIILYLLLKIKFDEFHRL